MLDRNRQVYRRREPEHTILHEVVREQIETFLARARQRDHPVPGFVERELRAYLDCGILSRGFVRVHCDTCGLDRVVGFSCKGRSLCPSCGARRVAETAARLVDDILPIVPVRQWVVSFPFALRYRMAFDPALTTDVVRVCIRAVFASLRRRARRQGTRGRLQCGAVTFIQRAGDALNLNPHLHALFLDGVYERAANGRMRFHPVVALDDAEVARVTARIARNLERMLARRGLGPEAGADEADPLSCDEPLLAGISAASIRRRIAIGRRAGQPVVRLGDRIDADDLPEVTGPLCANWNGVSLHAAVCVPAHDRRRLERLVRYVARSPVSLERLSRAPDGRLVYKLKRRWRDGTTHVVFEPADFITKLAALVPPPRAHLVRYFGVLAPCAGERDRVVPGARTPTILAAHTSCPPNSIAPDCDSRAGARSVPQSASNENVPLPPSPRPGHGSPQPAPKNNNRAGKRPSWAELMRRVWALDVLACPRCAGRMRIIAAICGREAKEAILECLGLPSRAPPTAEPTADDDPYGAWSTASRGFTSDHQTD